MWLRDRARILEAVLRRERARAGGAPRWGSVLRVWAADAGQVDAQAGELRPPGGLAGGARRRLEAVLAERRELDRQVDSAE
jgi:hypothetical protein